MSAYDPTEPISILRDVTIVENGDPMVDFSATCPDLMLDKPRFHYRRETYMRSGLVERLLAADLNLRESGYRLLILEGWRSPIIQHRMYRAVEIKIRERYPQLEGEELRHMVETFTAPLSDEVPPPHSTGGAVDLALADIHGNPLDAITPYETYDPVGFLTAAPGLSEAAQRHRHILAEALLAQGVTNYASEYWHWSYGDQGWAYRGNHAHALYGAVAPTDWASHPDDDVDAPLAFIEP